MTCPDYRSVFEDDAFAAAFKALNVEEEPAICAYCCGSGEGQTARTICRNCEGRGTVQDTIGSL